MRLSKYFLWLVPILGVAAFISFLAIWNANAGVDIPEPEPVTVPVTRGDITLSILAPGQLVSMKERILGPGSSGILDILHVKPGSVVQSGDPIASFLRQEDPLRAPFGGNIVELMARPGESLATGQPLALLIDPSALEVRVTVIEEDFPLLEIGQPAELYFDAIPELGARGQVRRIVPYRIPNEDRPLYEVYVSIDTPDSWITGLVPGMTADAAISVAEVKDALRLPRGLLRVDGSGHAMVTILQAGERLDKNVRTGLRGDAYIEIVEGLSEGDQVIERGGS